MPRARSPKVCRTASQPAPQRSPHSLTEPPCPGGFVVFGEVYARVVRPATAVVIIVLLALILIAGIFQALAIIRAS